MNVIILIIQLILPGFLHRVTSKTISQENSSQFFINKLPNILLTKLINACEFSDDPYLVSDLFKLFMEQDSYEKNPKIYRDQHDLYKAFQYYIAFSIIKKVSLHFESIDFDSLISFVWFLKESELIDFLVSNSLISQFSAHINMFDRIVIFSQRGSQHFISSFNILNSQLGKVFSGFQTITNQLPFSLQDISVSSSDENSKDAVYTFVIKDRLKEIERRVHLQESINEEKKNEEMKIQQEKIRKFEENERLLRLEEQRKAEERRKKEELYDFHYAEISILCSELNKDIKEFLNIQGRIEEQGHPCTLR